MPLTITHWTWEEAFDKFGFDDGDGQVMTYAVSNALENAGYDTLYDTFGIHNSVIFSLTAPDGTLIFDQDTVDVGYADPREYLPAEVVALLDAAFPPLEGGVSLEVNGLTVNVTLGDEGVVVDAFTDTNNPPIATTYRLYAELEN